MQKVKRVWTRFTIYFFFFFYSVKLVRKLDGTEVLREYVIIESVWSVQRQSRVDYTIIGRFWNLRGPLQLKKALYRQLLQKPANIPLCCHWCLAARTEIYFTTLSLLKKKLLNWVYSLKKSVEQKASPLNSRTAQSWNP